MGFAQASHPPHGDYTSLIQASLPSDPPLFCNPASIMAGIPVHTSSMNPNTVRVTGVTPSTLGSKHATLHDSQSIPAAALANTTCPPLQRRNVVQSQATAVPEPSQSPFVSHPLNPTPTIPQPPSQTCGDPPAPQPGALP